MIDRKNSAGESGSTNPWVLAAGAICAVLVMAAAIALVPPTPPLEISSADATTFAGPTGYFPAQFVNQAKEIEPLPPTF